MLHLHCSRWSSLLAVWIAAVVLPAAASAVTTVYTISGSLDDGFACPTSTDAGSCAADATFIVDGSFAVSGTLTYDDALDLVDVSLTVTSASLVGSQDGIVEVVFESTDYVVENWSVVVAGNQIFGIGAPAGTVDGSYSGLDVGSSLVQGPTLFTDAANFTSLSCLLSGSGGQCGLFVGANRDFSLSVGSTPTDFVHGFNFGILPEPSAGLMLAVGLLVLRGGRPRDA